MNAARFLITACSEVLLADHYLATIARGYNNIGRNKKIKKLYLKGYSIVELGKKFNLTRERIRVIVIEEDKSEHEINLRRRHNLKRESREEKKSQVKEAANQAKEAANQARILKKLDKIQKIAELWNSGLPRIEIANRLGMNQGYLETFIHRNRQYFPYRRGKKQ